MTLATAGGSRSASETAPSVPERFAAAAAARPRAVALSEPGGRRLTFRELDAAGTTLARRLHAAGVRPEEPVAVAVPRSADLVVALLGVLRAGAAYVPVDAAEPPARVAALAADAGVRLGVADPGPRSAALPAQVRLIPPRDRTPEPNLVAPVRPPADPARLAAFMYTSGSTGARKAVTVEHRNILNLVTDPSFITLGPGDRLLQLAPVAFDASTFEIWGALLNGAELVLAPERALLPDELTALIRGSGVTVLWLTAALFHEQIDEDIEAFRALRTVLAGGDVLSPAHVRRLRAEVPQCGIVNGYGPTETTTFACCHTVAGTEPLDRSVPLGRPVQHVNVHIVDSEGRPAPTGHSGELLIGGRGVTRGYWHRPALTAQRFIPDAWGGTPGARTYRSGDRARRTPQGHLEFEGRVDDQFKLRGHRIEPGEIEAVLTAHPNVRQAAVALHTSRVGDKRLVAYVTSYDGAPFEERELRRYVAERLPPPLLPAMVVPLPRLPLTPAGKLDRAALPEPDWSAGDAVALPAPQMPLSDDRSTLLFDDDDIPFLAVVNHEEQYSIWPEHLPVPEGWRPAGCQGTRQECLDYIERVWTDMRPLSLRRAMAEAGEQ